MANEITLSVALACTKNGASVAGTLNLTESMSGNNFIGNVQSIGTSSELLVVGDVANPPGYLFVKNLDPVNFIQIDAASAMTSFPQKLLAGEGILLKPQTNAIYGKADTAACNVQIIALDP